MGLAPKLWPFSQPQAQMTHDLQGGPDPAGTSQCSPSGPKAAEPFGRFSLGFVDRGSGLSPTDPYLCIGAGKCPVTWGWLVHPGRYLFMKDMFIPSVNAPAPVSSAPLGGVLKRCCWANSLSHLRLSHSLQNHGQTALWSQRDRRLRMHRRAGCEPR